MHTIYIAGPYRAATAWDIEQNIRRAERDAMTVAEAGHAFVCPHTMTRHMDGTITDDYWLAMTIELMRRCDAVLVGDGWASSEGTCAEVEEAKRLGIPVYFTAVEAIREAGRC